jgi:hypothetical protein
MAIDEQERIWNEAVVGNCHLEELRKTMITSIWIASSSARIPAIYLSNASPERWKCNSLRIHTYASYMNTCLISWFMLWSRGLQSLGSHTTCRYRNVWAPSCHWRQSPHKLISNMAWMYGHIYAAAVMPLWNRDSHWTGYWAGRTTI